MTKCKPDVVYHKSKPACKVSVILLDWGVRESFHTLDYLNDQTADREIYELIWLEFYDRRPQALYEKVFAGGSSAPLLDKWIVAGYPEDHIFNKHRLYNVGILAAEGEICVICDSDAIFTPHFIDKIIHEFSQSQRLVLHLDEIRNDNRQLYPFCYPTMDELLGEGCINWHETVSRGLKDTAADRLHEANYGACMAARRCDFIAIGGADEHLDYLGYICGPYELTFRLVNSRYEERWLRDEYIYHTWHPNQSGINTDYQGPDDGKYMSLRALSARSTGRVKPWVENPWIAQVRQGQELTLEQLLANLREKEEPHWQVSNAPRSWEDTYLVECDHHGFNVFLWKNRWYALPIGEGKMDPRKIHRYHTLIDAKCIEDLRHLIEYHNELPAAWWDRLWTSPLHHLPVRILRRAKRELLRFL